MFSLDRGRLARLKLRFHVVGSDSRSVELKGCSLRPVRAGRPRSQE